MTTEKFLENYSRLMGNSNVRVITADLLSELLDGNLGE
jgi:hypothetical protein